MTKGPRPGLERSCGRAVADWVRVAPSSPGLERAAASLSGHAFDPHRHDTYAVGFTTAGVQAFRYRGGLERSLPGQVFVLHPDELHDGRAGTGAGFCYSIAYVDPRLIQDALGAPRRPLPFVRDAVSHDRRLAAVLGPALEDLDRPLEDLERDQIIAELADALVAADPTASRRKMAARHWRAAAMARELLDASVAKGLASAALEAATGLTRYALARHFRACWGTTPYRYLTLRRLDLARALIRRGTGLAEAATASGFADQSHLTRHFRKAYGLPPGRWAALVARPGESKRDSPD